MVKNKFCKPWQKGIKAVTSIDTYFLYMNSLEKIVCVEVWVSLPKSESLREIQQCLIRIIEHDAQPFVNSFCITQSTVAGVQVNTKGHWVDSSSWRLWGFITKPLSDHSVLLSVTFRSRSTSHFRRTKQSKAYFFFFFTSYLHPDIGSKCKDLCWIEIWDGRKKKKVIF